MFFAEESFPLSFLSVRRLFLRDRQRGAAPLARFRTLARLLSPTDSCMRYSAGPCGISRQRPDPGVPRAPRRRRRRQQYTNNLFAASETSYFGIVPLHFAVG